jgi:hypothetical protein
MDVAIMMTKTDAIFSLIFGLTWFILVVIHMIGLSKPLPDRSMVLQLPEEDGTRQWYFSLLKIRERREWRADRWEVLTRRDPFRDEGEGVETTSEREHEILPWTAFDLDNAILHYLAG